MLVWRLVRKGQPMPALSLDSMIRRGAAHVETQAGGQTMMMSVSMGRYYALEGTAQRIWDALSEPCRLGEIVAKLQHEYDVTQEQCAADVLSFAEVLLDNGLIEEVV